MRERVGVMEVFNILIRVMTTWVYMFDKTRQILSLKIYALH